MLWTHLSTPLAGLFWRDTLISLRYWIDPRLQLAGYRQHSPENKQSGVINRVHMKSSKSQITS